MKNIKLIAERFKEFIYNDYYPKDPEKENIFTWLNYDCFTESLELFLIDKGWVDHMVEGDEDPLEILNQMKENKEFHQAFGQAFRQITADLVWTYWD